MVRVHQLEIMAGIGIADHELKSIGPEISGPFPLTVPGNKLPNTADSSANLSTQYTQPIGNDPSFIGGIDYSRLGKTYWTLDNVLSEPTYNLVDPRLSFKWERFKLTGVVENLFDEEYFAQVFDQRWSGFVTNIGWPARPRYYGVELAFEF